MKLYVTRHGQTQYNIENRICGRSNVCLTDKGINQAKDLANRLVGTDIDLIISSPLIRAKQTALVVGDKIGVPVIFEDRLMERDYGAVDGTYEGIPSFIKSFMQFGYEYPEGETLLKVIQRVYNLIDDIKVKYSDKNVLIISHGGVCRVINSYFSSLNNEEFFDFNLGNCMLLEYSI